MTEAVLNVVIDANPGIFMKEGNIGMYEKLMEIMKPDIDKAISEAEAKTKLISLIIPVCKKLMKGKDALQIADELEASEDLIAEICRAAEAEAPEYDTEKIYKRLRPEAHQA